MTSSLDLKMTILVVLRVVLQTRELMTVDDFGVDQYGIFCDSGASRLLFSCLSPIDIVC
jgi:hypothetical protein